MKILHFSSAKTWRGGEQQIAYLYEELQLLNIQQWIFCVENSALADYCMKKKIRHFVYKKRFSINPLIAWQLKKNATKLKIDLIHIHDSHSHTFSYFAAILGNKTPLILSRRVDFPVQKNWFSYQKYNHSAIKKIISVSKNVQQILASAIYDKTKLGVVHSGIDLSRFQFSNQHILRTRYNIPKAVKIIANVAAIAPHKDYFTFIDTAAILLKKNNLLKFFVIGADGGEEERIKKYVLEKKVKDYFVFTGFRNDLPKILPEIDVFLYTSKEEGLGTSIIDALACGIPVVATDAGGITEIIKDNENGLLSPIKTAQGLAENVEKVLDNQLLKARLCKAGKITARQFSKKEMALQTFRVYQEVLLS